MSIVYIVQQFPVSTLFKQGQLHFLFPVKTFVLILGDPFSDFEFICFTNNRVQNICVVH